MNRYESYVGKVLDGRYKILELVGMGGMACVLKAQDLVMNRVVAIKILNDEYNGNEAAEQRFIDESKAVAMLSHKNIVSVYDVAIYPDIKYIVMEFLDGITMREYLDNKGALDWNEACIYTLNILRALEHAHGKGIVHRDIKPQNVMLLRNGDIKVTDFGIAKLPNDTGAKNPEKAIGTVYYISPEQACGKETDYYSDIYSVGIMFYEAVTGKLPFVAETPMEVAMMQVNDEPVNPRDIVLSIPLGVSQIILKAIEKSPSDRFTSAHSMAKAIEWVLRNPDVIFLISSTGTEQPQNMGNSNVISIDGINTAEIQPYGEEEITEKVAKKKKDKAKKTGSKKAKAKKAKKKKTSRSMFPIIAGVTFAFLIVAIVMGATIGINLINQVLSGEEPEEVVFPNLTNKFYTPELQAKLDNKEFGARFAIKEIINVEDNNTENGLIMKTDPPAGHTARPDENGIVYFESITVNVSQKVIIPDVTGYSRVQAVTILQNLGLTVDAQEDTAYDNPYYYDEQVTKTYPVAEEECKVGDTVTVYFCKRTDTGKTGSMPNCVGLTVADALKQAQTYALYTVVFNEVPTVGGTGKVVSQSIPEGTVSLKGTEVILTVATPFDILLDLSGLTYSGAVTEAGLDKYVGNIYYYKTNPVNEEGIFVVGRASADIAQCGQMLLDIGCLQATAADDPTGKGVIVFQSLPKDTVLTPETKVDIIIVVLDETLPM